MLAKLFQCILVSRKYRFIANSNLIVLLKALNDGWGYSVTQSTHEKHYGSGSEVPILPPWHQSVIQPQWTFNDNRAHYSHSY